MKIVIIENVEFELEEGDFVIECPNCSEFLQFDANVDELEECAFCGDRISPTEATLIAEN